MNFTVLSHTSILGCFTSTGHCVQLTYYWDTHFKCFPISVFNLTDCVTTIMHLMCIRVFKFFHMLTILFTYQMFQFRLSGIVPFFLKYILYM